MLDHGDGPGARWARAVRPGQEVLFGKPEGPLVVRPAPYHVFAGEETASVAFGPMLAALSRLTPGPTSGASSRSATRPTACHARAAARPAAGAVADG